MVVDGLDLTAFSEPIRLGDLNESGFAGIPAERGVYVVLRKSSAAPAFLERSPAGWFKGLDPSYPLAFVKSNWVSGAHVLYVGKAESRRGGLANRVRHLVRFGFGHSAAHRGGRLIWHLADAAELQLRWHLEPDANTGESQLIEAFRAAHGIRPFANLRK